MKAKLLAVCVAAAVSVGLFPPPVGAHFEMRQYSWNGGCLDWVDPISVIFYGNGDINRIRNHIGQHTGWGDANFGGGQFFQDHGTCQDIDRFDGFPLYFLGESFSRSPLTAIFRVNALNLPGENVRRNDVSFIYGKCHQQDHACLPPIQVQVWDACERYPALYPFEAEKTFALRGTRAATYDGGRRLEIYTDRVTLVLFGADPARVLASAAALRGANNGLTTTDTFPQPRSDVAAPEGANCAHTASGAQ